MKGQMLVFAAVPGLIRHIILHEGRYLIPRKDGRILVGSTVEHTGFDKATSEEARASLIDFALSVLPELALHPVEKHWAGLRPGSLDGIPVIGAHPEIPNLFFNCGQFRNGFALAPASSRLLADLLLKREPCVVAEPYSALCTSGRNCVNKAAILQYVVILHICAASLHKAARQMQVRHYLDTLSKFGHTFWYVAACCTIGSKGVTAGNFRRSVLCPWQVLPRTFQSSAQFSAASRQNGPLRVGCGNCHGVRAGSRIRKHQNWLMGVLPRRRTAGRADLG